jgi:hypothetical protein
MERSAHIYIEREGRRRSVVVLDSEGLFCQIQRED